MDMMQSINLESHFDSIFGQATAGDSAYPYQRRLATDGLTASHLLNVPTGLGKTAAAVLVVGQLGIAVFCVFWD